MHICGFWSESQIRSMKDKVEKLTETCKCDISYDGYLHGEEYISFLQTCDIGLSTQSPDGAFNATSFPLKILSYMSNGLRVVSIRIPAIENSAVGRYMKFYDIQDPNEIVKTIMSVNLQDRNEMRGVLRDSDSVFRERIQRYFEKLSIKMLICIPRFYA